MLPDGSREARIYSAPINYRDEEGEWQPIDTKLRLTADGSAVVNGENRFDIRLPEAMDLGPVRVAEGAQWVSYRLLGANADLKETSGETATYAMPSGATIKFTSIPTGLKEEIVLTDPAQPSSFAFALNASDGLSPILAEDGSIRFVDAQRHVFAELPAPTIADSNGEDGSEHAISYSLDSSRDDGSWRLVVAADKGWLAAADRAWPVTIDPTTVKTNVGNNCTIGSLPAPNGWRACGDQGQATLSAVYDPITGEAARTFLRFVTKAVPKNAYIHKATVSLWSPSAAQNTLGLEILTPTKAWSKEVTWAKFDVGGSRYWTTPGGDFDSPAAGQVLTSERGTAAGWWHFSSPMLARAVRSWRDGAIDKNLGIAVKQISESKAACEGDPTKCSKQNVSFSSSATTPAENRPYVSIEYFPAAPSTSKVISPSEGTRTARRLKLQSGWSVQGVTGVIYQFREGRKGYFDTIPAHLVRDAKGQAVAEWPYPVSGVKQSPPLYFDAAHASPTLRSKGGKVQVRAVFVGTLGAEGFSQPVETEVNRFLGGPRDASAEIGPGSVDLLTGNLTVSRSDVSVASFNSELEFARVHNSRDSGKLGDTGVLGQGWKPTSPVEAGGSEWRSVRLETFSEEIEDETYSFAYAILTSSDGYELAFEKDGEAYVTPDDAAGFKLSAEGTTKFILGDPGGNRTTFESVSGGAEYLPVSVTQAGNASQNTTKMVYDFINGKRRLAMLIAATRTTCSESNATSKVGCKALTFSYANASKWGAPSTYGDRLERITLHASGHGGPWVVVEYKYDSAGRLIEAWDPRISPALPEKYTYEAGGQLKTVAPAGLKPWTLEYGAIDEEEANGRLMRVKRDSLVEGTPVAQTTIAYEVPISGAGAPHDLSGGQVARWGQQEIPVDATAIFPPDQVPTSSPPGDYAPAVVHYLNAQGEAVNTATPSGAGTEAASISTSETDQFGNVIRELTPQNRLRALSKESKEEEISRAIELDTHRQYSADGTEMLEEWGPLHPVRLSSGVIVQARFHRTVEYDAGAPSPKTGLPMPHLPTRETTGASDPKVGEDKDQQVTEYRYDWTLRKPTETIIDPSGLNIRSVTVYNQDSGLPIEYRQPSNPGGGGAGSLRIVYFNHHPAPGESSDSDCINPTGDLFEYLPCKIKPVAQPGGSQPKVLVRRFLAYNALAQPTESTERPGGEGATRKVLSTYDSAGRPLTRKIEGGGVAVPMTKTEYSVTTGLPTTQRFVCSPICWDDDAVTTAYDSLGRATSYVDADGNTSTVAYDLAGRPTVRDDGKGTQQYTYDPTSGLLTKLDDSAAGTFTASYDADGNLVAEGLPNGLVAESTYDETGARTDLAYNKVSNCSEECRWLEFAAERSIDGQILAQSSSLSRQQFRYDKAGRLIQAKDWNAPVGGSCTTRDYMFEGEVGKNSNRTKMATRVPGIGGACTESGGTEQSYSYDTADRLIGTGVVYDDFGRTTSLPAPLAGGNAVSSSYFSTDMVASQTQGGVTNTFQLDASLRQRQRTQGGGLEGVEVFHYSDSSDSAAWTQLGSNWSRNSRGVSGDLVAIQDSSAGTLLQLTNLHGDVVATATLNPGDTEPVSTYEYDEFGVPKQEGPRQFGWLGGKSRRTEFSSGVIQMGARSYVPALGRFLTPDPIRGGSANAYEYAHQDPVNAFDLDGNCSTKKVCAAKKRRIVASMRRAIANVKALVRQRIAAERASKRTNFGPVSVQLPWAERVHDAVNEASETIAIIQKSQKCGEAAVAAGSAGVLLEWRANQLLAQAGSKIAGGLETAGKRFIYAGAGLALLGLTPFC